MRSRVLSAVLLAVVCAGLLADEPEKRQIGQMVLEGIPEWDDAVRQRMLQYLNVRGASLQSISADGRRILIATRFGDTTQLHVVDAPLAARRQVTFFDEPAGGGAFIPGSNGRRLLYSKDRGGDEKDQFYTLDLATGRHTLLTDGRSRHADGAVSRDGRRLAFTGTARNERDFDLYTLDLSAGGKPQLLLEREGNYYVSEFSPDGGKILLLRYVSAKETQWFVVDAESGENVAITPTSPPTYYGGGVWGYQGRAVYLTSDRDGDFRKLYRHELDTDAWHCLTTNIDWDVSEVAVEPRTGGVAFIVNEGGISRLFFADARGNARKLVTGLPTGIISGLSFSTINATLGLTINSAGSPSDAYTVSYPDGRVTRWTRSEIGGLNSDGFVSPELFHFPTFDTVQGKPREIPAFLYKPAGNGPHPVVIYAHGGPESQFRPGFISTFQYWVNELGICVIATNVRGSTGYGRAFHQLDNGVKREDSVKDIGALLDWIEKQPELDSGRIGIFGGSYGGYMVLESLANYPKRFKAGIDIVGIASFITFLEKTPEYRRNLRREEYGDERDPVIRKVLERISPLNNAEKIQAALFVAHGKNDARVPVHEAEQIVAKMRALGRPVWYALALDEGHGFRKRTNRDLASVLYAVFWQEHLLK